MLTASLPSPLLIFYVPWYGGPIFIHVFLHVFLTLPTRYDSLEAMAKFGLILRFQRPGKLLPQNCLIIQQKWAFGCAMVVDANEQSSLTNYCTYNGVPPPVPILHIDLDETC